MDFLSDFVSSLFSGRSFSSATCHFLPFQFLNALFMTSIKKQRLRYNSNFSDNLHLRSDVPKVSTASLPRLARGQCFSIEGRMNIGSSLHKWFKILKYRTFQNLPSQNGSRQKVFTALFSVAIIFSLS